MVHRADHEIVVVCVDAATKLRCLHETFGAHLVGAIERNVELEEACVRLWEPCLVHARVQANLVPSRKSSEVDREPISTPDELQIETALFV